MNKIFTLLIFSTFNYSVCQAATGIGSPDTDNSSLGAVNSSQSQNPLNQTKRLTVTSNILGLADTGNKTSLKKTLVYTSGPGDINLYYYNEAGERVLISDQTASYPLKPVEYSGEAVLSLGNNIDDSKIDSSHAVVKLLNGNSYYADEFILKANRLNKGSWSNGEYVYTLSEGDLEWNTWGYDTSPDYNSGREWSIMGGDGNGVYNFIFQVSGIRYNGQEVPPATFHAAVYIYGRTVTDMALSTAFTPNTYDKTYSSGRQQTNQTQWVWTTADTDSLSDHKPYLNDEYSDYFSIIWPKGSNASEITAKDVTITLRSKFGDEYTLSPTNAYGEQEYAVLSSNNETEVIVTYQQWNRVPVYSSMKITVNNGSLTASKTYAVDSVSAYMVQTGGGGVTVDHTNTIYNYYGLHGMTLENAANTYYTLSTDVDGTTYYYAEDSSGNAYLSPADSDGDAPSDAWKGDATAKYNIAVHGNVVFRETRTNDTQEREVDGTTYTFTENVSVTKDIATMVKDGVELDDGFNQVSMPTSFPAWTTRYQSGWTLLTPKPTALPYVSDHYGYGYEPGSSNPAYDQLVSEETSEE